MKTNNNEFDTSFLNDVQSFEDFNTDEVFSFDSSMDNVNEQKETNEPIETNNDSESIQTESDNLKTDNAEMDDINPNVPNDGGFVSFSDLFYPKNDNDAVLNTEQPSSTDDSYIEDNADKFQDGIQYIETEQENKESSIADNDDSNDLDSTSEILDNNTFNNFEIADNNSEDSSEDNGSNEQSQEETDDSMEHQDNAQSIDNTSDFSPFGFNSVQSIPSETDVENKDEIPQENDVIEEPVVELETTDEEKIESGEDATDINEEVAVEETNNNEISDQIEESATPSEQINDSESETDQVYEDFEGRLEELSKETENSSALDPSVSSDINGLFVKVNSNVKEASDIFLKNVEMKKKIDARFEELKQLQASIEKSKKDDYEEINNYKDKVINELLERKSEIENRLNELKELQNSLAKEKEDFETYKRDEKMKLDDLKREADATFESHKDELDKLENKLRKQKNALDEERRQLSLDQIQYESDKNELANNMLKFNEIVGTFTNGVDQLN